MALVPDKLAHCNYPIETPIQIKFWASRHKCNEAKAVIAFSYDEENAHRNMRRLLGWTYFFRKRALDSFSQYLNTPSMAGIPFSEGDTAYWECMPGGGGKPPVDTAPTVSILTTAKPVSVGDNVVITARVTGRPTPTIEWKVSENGKETTLTDTDDSVSYTVKEAGDVIFTCTATNSVGSASDTITYTSYALPTIDSGMPADVTITEGEDATFTTTGTGAVSYKWYMNGKPAPSTSKDITIPAAPLSFNGFKFKVDYINAAGAKVTSREATLTVNPKALGSINFTLGIPEDVVIDKLQPVQLVATTSPVNLDGDPVYQWKYSEDGSSWSNVLGKGDELSYYLSMVETPPKGETRYFKCTGNATSGGVPIPEEETRVVSVTYTDTGPARWDDSELWGDTSYWEK